MLVPPTSKPFDQPDAANVVGQGYHRVRHFLADDFGGALEAAGGERGQVDRRVRLSHGLRLDYRLWNLIELTMELNRVSCPDRLQDGYELVGPTAPSLHRRSNSVKLVL